MFDGTYPQEAWHDVRDLVVDLGRRHGFTEANPQLDQPGALDFELRDGYGATMHLGMGNTTVLGGVLTGCHRWKHPPAPQETR